MTIHQQVTLGVIVATAATLIGYDIWVAWAWGNDATISVVTRRLGWGAPIVVIAWGVLSGHLFGRELVGPLVLGYVLSIFAWGQGQDARLRRYLRRGREDVAGGAADHGDADRRA